MKYKRLIISFFFSIACISFLALYALGTSRQIDIEILEQTAHFKHITSAAAQVASYAKRAEGHLMLYLSLGRPIDKDKVPKRIQSMKDQIRILDDKVTTPLGRRIADEMKTMSVNTLEICIGLINAHDSNGTKGEFAFKDHEDQIVLMHAQFSGLRKLGVRLTEHKIKTEDAYRASIIKKTGQLGNYFRISIAAAAVVALFLGTVLFGMIRVLNREIAERRAAQKDLETERDKLTRALSKIKTLNRLLPICSSCKKIRDDNGYWSQIEQYIEAHSEAEFTHSVCPECAEKLYGNEAWFGKLK